MLYDFKEGTVMILVATDVAARGLDVKDIRMVINFDFPNEMEVRDAFTQTEILEEVVELTGCFGVMRMNVLWVTRSNL